MYIRVAVSARDESSDQPRGIFTELYALERSGKLEAYELQWFHDITWWFNKNLKTPDRLAWSSRPNAPKRAISWLKLSAAEHVRRMRELATLLEHKDIAVDEIRTEKPGYILYEDEHQVAAMPFSGETF
jgi:hypothetical protein